MKMKKGIPWNLLIASLKKELDNEETTRLNYWKESKENAKLYDRLSQIWFGVQDLSAIYLPDKDYYWRKLYKQMQKDKKKRRLPLNKKSFNLLGYLAAACVALLLLIGGGTYWVIADLKEQIQQEVRLSNLSGRSQVVLADGTKVWLHTNTSLDYKRNFQTKNREVRVSGEAFFEVAHDSRHPFVVQMDGMKLTVYGTKFNIRDFPLSNGIQVSLQEGAVELETSRESYRLLPGEKAFFDKMTNTLQIERRDVNFDISWAQSQIVFHQKTLGYICRYLEKWYNVQIVLAPELKDKCLYTFTLRDEPLEEIMRLIARINPIHYTFNEGNKLFINIRKEK